MSTAIATTTLDQLAEDINQAHREAEQALNTGLAHAFRCGELLAEAKTQCKHGEWIPWLEENFDSSARTAQNYMKLAARRVELEAGMEANTQPVSHLGVKEALKLTAEPKPQTCIEAFSGLLDEDVLDAIPELSPDVILRGFEEDSHDCMVEVYPCVGDDGYFHLVVYQGLAGPVGESYVKYDKRGCKYDRRSLAAALEKIHHVRPTMWGTYPATGEIPRPVKMDMAEMSA